MAWVVDRRRPPADLLDAQQSAGWDVRPGFDLPDVPWDLGPRRWLRWGSVERESDLAEVVGAAARGVAVVVGCDDPAVLDLLREDLARLGPVEVVSVGPDPLDGLDEDQRELLAALASGASIAEAAATLFLSTRTAERRLAGARRALGVRTTAEAVAVAAG